jgi:hypothetical protein
MIVCALVSTFVSVRSLDFNHEYGGGRHFLLYFVYLHIFVYIYIRNVFLPSSPGDALMGMKMYHWP